MPANKNKTPVIHADPEEVLAVKGLLDVAERILKVKNKPAAALKVYTFLLEHNSDAGMAEVIQDGIEQCHDVDGAAANDERPDVSAGG